MSKQSDQAFYPDEFEKPTIVEQLRADRDNVVKLNRALHTELAAAGTVISALRAQLAEARAAMEACRRTIWPFFEGEHWHDHPDAVKFRNALAEYDRALAQEGKTDE